MKYIGKDNFLKIGLLSILLFAFQAYGQEQCIDGETRGACCEVDKLPPITDPAVQSFEDGNRVVTDPTYFKLNTELNCLKNKITNAGGNYSLNSAYRPQGYQDHLRAVYDGWNEIEDRREPKCAIRRQEYRQEYNKHGPFAHRPTPRVSNHTKGLAFDLNFLGISEAKVDQLADQCGLRRPLPVKDRPHFIRK